RRGSIRFWRPGHCLSLTPQSDAPPSDGLARGEPTALIFDGGDRLIALDTQALRVWPHPPAREGIHSVTRTDVPGGVWTMFPAPIARASGGRSLFVARGARVLAWDPESPDHWSNLSLPPLARATHTDAVRDWEPPLAWRALAASQAGDRLYLLDQSGGVHALALEGTTAHRLDWDLPIEATGLALSPDGATLALGDRLGNVALVDTTRGTIRARLRPTAGESDGRVAALAFAPDGRTLAVGSLQGPVALWATDAPSAPLARLPGHRGLVTALAFAPEGRYLATGGTDNLVNVWDLECLRRELGKLGLAW
ncbi:MAG: hypothetical protein JO329_19305, partial [Planctomycetaceae bacterium]|nr:hypothetical protein [Planctomycetaceae bacterium]